MSHRNSKYIPSLSYTVIKSIILLSNIKSFIFLIFAIRKLDFYTVSIYVCNTRSALPTDSA